MQLEQWLLADINVRERELWSSLQRIQELDKSICAWVQVDPQPPTGHGPLEGIPFGAKDIMETWNLATEYGSPIYKGRQGTSDAAIVRELRDLGAILLGKTQTAAFAHTNPPPTRNPRNLAHTPGGSSSGSAAAVAADMVPFALGTQTGGSVLRPASFCGVTGFKPTYGLFSLEGVLPFARSLDTLGFFTDTPGDMLLLWEALGKVQRGGSANIPLGVVEPVPTGAEPLMAGVFQSAVSLLRARGMELRPVHITPMLEQLSAENRIVSDYEGARFHEQRYREYGLRLQDVATLVEDGLEIPSERYDQALASIAEGKREIEKVYQDTPVILVPAATGPAPKGLTSTGDSRINRAWAALGTPAISIPMPVRNELPLGLQLTAALGDDTRLLQTAVRIAAQFNLRA